MNEAPAAKPHGRWLGVVLSLIAPGAGLFFSGVQRAGVIWFLAFALIDIPLMYLFISPSINSAVLILIAAILFLCVWLLMLVKSFRNVPRRGAVKLAAIILFCFLLRIGGFAARQSIAPAFAIAGNSMTPALRGPQVANGVATGADRIIVSRFTYLFWTPQRGDVIVFRNDNLEREKAGTFYVKRVAGLPGETIALRDGHLSINGNVVQHRLLGALTLNSKPWFRYLRVEGEEYRIPDGCYFVLGDNPEKSMDSRTFGAVPAGNITGRCTKIWWPPERFGTPIQEP